jgi:hypothetical protein
MTNTREEALAIQGTIGLTGVAIGAGLAKSTSDTVIKEAVDRAVKDNLSQMVKGAAKGGLLAKSGIALTGGTVFLGLSIMGQTNEDRLSRLSRQENNVSTLNSDSKEAGNLSLRPDDFFSGSPLEHLNWDGLSNTLNSPWFAFITCLELVLFIFLLGFLARSFLQTVGLKEEDGKKYQVLKSVMFFLMMLSLQPYKPLAYLAHQDSYLSVNFLDVIIFSELHL